MAAVSDPVVKLLKKAKKIIADPRHWTKESYARDEDGMISFVYSPKSVSFCSLGAIRRAAGNDAVLGDYTEASAFFRNALPQPHVSIAAFNDDPNTTHTDVTVAFDKAIRLAEGKSA